MISWMLYSSKNNKKTGQNWQAISNWIGIDTMCARAREWFNDYLEKKEDDGDDDEEEVNWSKTRSNRMIAKLGHALVVHRQNISTNKKAKRISFFVVSLASVCVRVRMLAKQTQTNGQLVAKAIQIDFRIYLFK